MDQRDAEQLKDIWIGVGAMALAVPIGVGLGVVAAVLVSAIVVKTTWKEVTGQY